MARSGKAGLACLVVVSIGCQADAPRDPDIIWVPSAPSCAQCEIVLDTTVILSGPSEAFVEWPSSAWLDSQGRIFLAQPNKRIPPAVFAPDGRFLTFLGREGEGPGEFRYAAHITTDAHDSIFIADRNPRRLTILGPDLTFVRSFPLPARVQSLAVLSDGRLASNSGSASDDRRSLHRFTREGSRDGSFGPPARGGFDYQFRIAPAKAGGFWAIRLWGRYLLGHVPSDSSSTWYESQPAWFLGFPDDPTLEQLPAHTWVRGIWESEDGLVWIASQAPSLVRAPTLDTIRPEGVAVTVARDVHEAFDTIIEVVDPRVPHVVASRRFDEVFSLSVGKAQMLHVRETDRGLQFLLVRVGLKRN